MAYEVSSSIAAGTNTFVEITGSDNSSEAGGFFSPDGTKLLMAARTVNGSDPGSPGFHIYTSSSSGYSIAETFVHGLSVSLATHGYAWRTDTEIFASANARIYPFLSSSTGWKRTNATGLSDSVLVNRESLHFNFDGTRLAAERGAYLDIWTTGASGWTRDSTNLANDVDAIAWVDNNTIAVGIPNADYGSHGKVKILAADNAADTTFTETESLEGEPGDQLGASIYYQTSSGDFVIGTDTDRSFTSFQTDMSSSLFVYQSSSAEGYLPADNSGRTTVSSSMRTPYGFQYSQERNNDNRFYMITKRDTNNMAELIAVEKGSDGWKATTIDYNVRMHTAEESTHVYRPSFVSSNGVEIITNNDLASNLNPSTVRLHRIPDIGLNPAAATPLTNTTTSSIGTGGGLVQAGNVDSDPDAQVNIPASALSGDTDIIVKIKQTASDKADAVTEIKQLASVPKGARAVSDIVAFEPHGQTLTSDAILSWNITGSTTGLKVYRRANPSSPWAEIDSSYYSFNGGQVHVTSSTFSEYMVLGGISSVAITQIGTKLIGDGTITTVKLGSSAVTRTDIQSGSVQVTHLDVNQGAGTHVDFLDDDFLIAGDATSNGARGFSFSQLKTALSLSNAARGDEGTIQYNNGTGFDGIAKIRTDGIHLTASDAGKVVLAFTGISGSTGELYADSADGLTIEAKTRIQLHSSGAVQGTQSGSVELRADGLFPSVKPAVAAQPGTFIFTFTSGGFGGANRTYSPVTTYNSQLITVLGTGSQAYIFYIDNASNNAPLPVSASLNLEYGVYGPGSKRFDIPVQGETSVTDWRDVVTNFYNAMNTELPAGLASVTYNQTSSINGTASIEVTYNSAAGIQGEINRGNSFTGASSADSISALSDGTNSRFYARADSDQTTPEQNGVSLSTIVAGSAAVSEDLVWLSLGASSRKYNEVHASVISGSGTSQIHKVDTDDLTANRIVQSRVGSELSGSGTATIHNLDVNEGTFGGVKFSSVRDAAAFALTGSGTANIHAVDIDLGTIDRVSAIVVTGSGTSQLHKVDSDLGTIDRVEALVVSGSGTSLFHKLTVDEGTHGKVATTAISGSGLVEFHNITAGDLSGSIGEFHKINTDHVNARVINSDVTTTENLEIDVKQLIPAVSQSAGAAQEGAGLQIGGAAGSGSAGIASVILGDAGSGAGADLLFKVGSTQGASLSGSISEGGQRFGVSGSISGSIGVFHEITVNQGLGAQDSIFSGSSFTGHLLSGSTAQAHFLDADEAQVADISGSAMTYNVITGSEANAHVVDVDTATLADIDGTTLTYATVSGSTLTANLANVDRLEGNDVDVSGQISGSATSTLHELTTDNISGSHIEVYELGSQGNYGDAIDSITFGSIVGDDVVAKEHIHNSVVKNDNNAHGGLVHNNGQLSVGWRRRIFSRSTKALINRTQPTQGSGSLYTTCSLSQTQIVSGSEMVYFNGLLLTKDNGQDGGNPQQGDYKIDYSEAGGVTAGTYTFTFTSGSTGGTSTVSTYGPAAQYNAQYLQVASTGSEDFLFFLSNGTSTNKPSANNLNMSPTNNVFEIRVEAISGITDWRDVVDNFYEVMTDTLGSAGVNIATITSSSAASVTATASIQIAYSSIPGGIQIGAARDGARSLDSNYFVGSLSNQSADPSTMSGVTMPLAGGDGVGQSPTDRVEAGSNGVTVSANTLGGDFVANTTLYLSENLAMDSDDVLVVQYLSGSHQF